jgi:hypothetical protein
MKDEALKKLNEEMAKPHSDEIDAIHNWLCDHIDVEGLAEGINDPKKSIAGAYEYCHREAKKLANGSQSKMVRDDVVFGWVQTYFTTYKPDVKPAQLKPAEQFKSTPTTAQMVEKIKIDEEAIKRKIEEAAKKTAAERAAKEEAKNRKRSGADPNQASIFDFAEL